MTLPLQNKGQKLPFHRLLSQEQTIHPPLQILNQVWESMVVCAAVVTQLVSLECWV